MFAWVLVIILAIWLINKYSKGNAAPAHSGGVISAPHNEIISEETVFERQNEFEKRLEQTYLPDSPSGRAIYIYRSLVCKWFYKLAADNRYNDEMTQKLRRDFLDYMYSTEHGWTAHYLSLELEDKESQDSYEEESRTHSRKTYTIENAFAAAIGKDAVEELEKARELSFSSVDRNGNLAPEGHHFDLSGNLKPIKKGK